MIEKKQGFLQRLFHRKKREPTSIKDLDKEIQEAINWVAAEFNYLKELDQALDEIETRKEIKEEERYYKKAWRILRYISRSERKAEIKIHHTIELLKIFIEKYPQLAKLESIETDIEVASRKLLKAFSFYTGNFKKQLAELILEIHKKKKTGADKNQEEEKIKQIVEEIREKVKVLIQWLQGLETSLKQAKSYIKTLRLGRGAIAAGTIARVLTGTPEADAATNAPTARIKQANVLTMVRCKFQGQNIVSFINELDLDINMLYSIAAANFRTFGNPAGLNIKQLTKKMNKPLFGTFAFPKRFKEALEAFPSEIDDELLRGMKEQEFKRKFGRDLGKIRTPQEQAKEKLQEQIIKQSGGIYIFKEEDKSIQNLAKRFYGTTKKFKIILDANPNLDPTYLQLGQRIIIPSPRKVREEEERKQMEKKAVEESMKKDPNIHIVEKGDSLGKIAVKYFGSTQAIKDISLINEEVGIDREIRIGQIIKLKIPFPNKYRTISQNGINLIKKFEHFESKAYPDPASPLARRGGLSGAPWTIGYGHTKGVKKGDIVTKSEAEKLLIGDLKWAEEIVKRKVRVILSQDQFDALVSFVFNLGDIRGNFLKILNQGDFKKATERMKLYIYGGGKPMRGLRIRREQEARLLLKIMI